MPLLLCPSSTHESVDAATWRTAIETNGATGWMQIAAGDDLEGTLKSIAIPGVKPATVRAARDRARTGAHAQDDVHVVIADLPGGGELEIIATSHAVLTTSDEPEAESVLAAVELQEGGDGNQVAMRALIVVARAYESAVDQALKPLVADNASEFPSSLASLQRLETTANALRRREQRPHTAWFPVSEGSWEAETLPEVLDQVIERARGGRREIIERQSALREHRQATRAASNQAVAGTVAAVFVGPTLIASVFQAVPGWQPVDHRLEAFLGLSLAAAGLI